MPVNQTKLLTSSKQVVFIPLMQQLSPVRVTNSLICYSVTVVCRPEHASVYLWTGIGYVEIMQSDILYHFFLLVNVTFRQRHVLFSFKVKFGGVRVRPTLTLT